MKLKEIQDFHTNQQGKCLSTSHTMTLDEFEENNLWEALSVHFKFFTVDVRYNNVKITISYH
jgi:hypothetical protein